MITEKAKLGEGIFTIKDVADILRLPKSQVSYWVKAYAENKLQVQNNYKYTFGDDRLKAVNFYMLIEIFVFKELKKRGIKNKDIFKAHQVLSKAYQTPYPFASVKLLSSGKEILTETFVKADDTMQIYFKEIIEPFSKLVEFDSLNSGLATKFYPLGKDQSIVVNPQHQFGQPVLENTNIKASTIYGLYKGGESVDFLSKLYKLPVSQINNAIKYGEERRQAA